MKLLFCGDRKWADKQKICTELQKYNPATDLIITGGAPGADSLSEMAAVDMKFKVMVVCAQWDKYGLAAGPIRNKEMLDLGPDKVIAFHSNIESSKGTKNCLEQATKKGIRVEIIV